jgi:phosphomannomutase
MASRDGRGFHVCQCQRAVHGIAHYVSSQKSNGADGEIGEIIIGRDPRFLGESFYAAAADVLSRYGITPLVIAEPAPQLAKLFDKVGSFYPLRENFRLTTEVKQKFTKKLRCDPSEFHGTKVARVVRMDGLKLVLADGSWVCHRLAGTEPVVRVYSEARSRDGLARLSGAARA